MSNPGGGASSKAASAKEVNLGNVSGNVNLDISKFTVFRAVLIGNTKFKIINAPIEPNISTPQLIITQDATGGRTFTVEELETWAQGEPAFETTAHSTIFVSLYVGEGGARIIGFGAPNGKEGAKGERGEKGDVGARGEEGIGSEELKPEAFTSLGENMEFFAEGYSPKAEAALQANGTVLFNGMLANKAEKTGGSKILQLPERLWPKFTKLLNCVDAQDPENNCFVLKVLKTGEVITTRAIPTNHILCLDGEFFDKNH